jgi:hypothetical protein
MTKKRVVSQRGSLRYATYDRQNDVVWVDATGVAATSKAVIDDIFDELDATAKSLPGRYFIACWKNVKIADAEVASHYGKRSAELLSLCKGIVRYAATDPLTRSYIRTETIKHRAEGSRSNLYESREEALAAVTELRKASVARGPGA